MTHHPFAQPPYQLILNEQYMVFAHDPGRDKLPNPQFTNKVIMVLSHHGFAYKTFGANIILLLNRESMTLSSPKVLVFHN